MGGDTQIKIKIKIKRAVYLTTLIGSTLMIPFSFNACGQQSYEVQLQGISSKGLAQGEASPVDSTDSASADNSVDDNSNERGPASEAPPSVVDAEDPTGALVPPPVVELPVVVPPVSEIPPVVAPVYDVVQQNITVSAQNKTDILIVEDDSGSMTYEQLSMANRFGAFISELQKLDWQLGITTTDVASSNPGKDGRLLPLRDSKGLAKYGNVLTSKMDPALVDDLFKSTIQRAPSEEGSPWEQGVFATYRFLERYFNLATENDSNRALLREAATLAVVFVTDADETPANSKSPGFKNQGENLKKYLKNQLGVSKRFAFHSIIVKPKDKDCLFDETTYKIGKKIYKNANENYGSAYAALSNDSGGLIGSVCDSDYGTQLQAIGKLVADSVRTANLQCAPVDMNQDGMPDLKAVGPNGELLKIDMVKDSTVSFSTDLPLGSTHLEYICLKK